MDDFDNFLISKLNDLPTDFWDFKAADTREYTHGLHNYPAMMIAPISRNIIRIVKSIRPIRALFDPFSGSGTVLVEGMIADIPHICGNDINPLAIFLSGVKTRPLSTDELLRETKSLYNRLDKIYETLSTEIQTINANIQKMGYVLSVKTGWGEYADEILSQYCSQKNLKIDIPSFKNIGYWFTPRAIVELSIIKAEILKITNLALRNFILIAFSEVIRLVSNRRNGEFKMFRIPAVRVDTFNPDVLAEFYKILSRNISKMADFIKEFNSKNAVPNVTIYNDNACQLNSVPDNGFDLIITSPPYGDSRTTVAYGEFSRLSLQWLSLNNMSDSDIMKLDRNLMGGNKFKSGFDFDIPSPTLQRSLEKIMAVDCCRAGDVYSFYSDMEKSIRAISSKTSVNGYHFWVVGNRTVKQELLQTNIILVEIAEHYGMRHLCTIPRKISNKVMPSKNSPTNITGQVVSTMCDENIVVLKKI